MENKHCLNCNKILTDKYCSGCGQKADTHRITLRNFISHDVLHGMFHIEKGMLFTAKEALLRPGKAALDYISGKRKPYYNVFLLILLIIGLLLFLKHYYTGALIEQGRLEAKDVLDLNEVSRRIDDIFSNQSKIVVLLFVPLAALNSFLLFRRKKLNLSEHVIIAGMILLGISLLYGLGMGIFVFDLFIDFNNTFKFVLGNVLAVLIFTYVCYGYVNAFGANYTKLGISYRVLLFFILLFIEITLIFLVVFGYVTQWEFGEVSLSPF